MITDQAFFSCKIFFRILLIHVTILLLCLFVSMLGRIINKRELADMREIGIAHRPLKVPKVRWKNS